MSDLQEFINPEFYVQANQDEILMNILSSIIDNSHEMFEQSAPTISIREAITEFKPENSIECLYYCSSAKTENKPVLYIEQSIAMDLYMIFILANDLELQHKDIEVTYIESTIPLVLLSLWVDVAYQMKQHKDAFDKMITDDKYAFTNTFVFELEKTIYLAAEAIIGKVNEILETSFTLEELLSHSIFNNPEVEAFITLQENLLPTEVLLKQVA